VLAKANTPIEIISVSNHLGIYYESRSNYPAALFYLAKAKKANKDNAFPEQSIITQNYIGYVYWHKSDYEKALFCHNKALEIAEEHFIQDENLAFTYLMLGNNYYDKGDFNQAASYYFKCLKLAESIHNKSIQVQGHNRLSKLYFKLKDYSLAIEHVNTALLLNNNNDLRELATSYNSLGNIALEKQNIDSALYYFTQTLLNFKKCGDVIGQSIASINLGDTYLMFDDKKNSNYIDSSYYYYEQSYILNQSVDNKFGMIYGLWGMADIVTGKNNFALALNKYREAMFLATQIGAKSEELNLYYKLFDLYDKKGVVDSSLFFLKKHVLLKNKVEGTEQAKQLLKQQSKYEFEKIIANEKAEAEKEKLIEREKNKWKNIIISIVIAVSVILIYVAYASIKRLKIIRSKNKLINTINEELHLQKKEIIDSITYAKRIQNVILPSNKLIKDNLPNSFILYLPKDIVAGDFYWLECVKGKGHNGADVVLFAAADCTGHGVPGAMVSVICNNGLNRSVREHGIINPGEILEKTRQIVVSEFEKSDEVVKDGMDISLCALSGKKLQWAGANNPLWIIRKNTDSEQEGKFKLIEIKADKQPIGKVDNPKDFTNHSFELLKNDTIYLFTDGYQDQFGGEKGKKYKASQLKQLLLSIQENTMEEQKQILHENIHAWKGNLEQVDDICIIGVRID
ncbi:MAG: tetratricopeptide repeat protein, partial [Bacteroidia bacterium]|nr:tetratricopeptide repeat protein [Bacteroidia bacterium]